MTDLIDWYWPNDWYWISAGNRLAAWIRRQDQSEWSAPFSDYEFFVSPELYLLINLKFKL